MLEFAAYMDLWNLFWMLLSRGNHHIQVGFLGDCLGISSLALTSLEVRLLEQCRELWMSILL